MNVLDYIILALFAIGLIVGIFKGFIKQILTVVGIFVVVTLTATVTPFVQNWLVDLIESESTRAVVAMIASVILIAAVYALMALLIRHLLKKVKIIKVLDRLLGGLIGLVVVYMVFSVIFALITSTSDTFMMATKNLLGETFEESWFGTHIYANNFFGEWVIRDIAEKILNSLQPAA